MKRFETAWAGLAAATVTVFATAAAGRASAPTAADVRAEVLTTGLTQPLYATAPAGDYARLFVLERGGLVKIVNPRDGTVSPTPFLDVRTLITTAGGEQGLLGLAFDPDFENSGRFYTNYTATNGATVVSRYTVSPTDPNLADPASRQTVITFAQPRANHNGGWIGFSPRDGYLYFPSGDGGGANDPDNLAQNLNAPHGKVLRLDVSRDDFPSDPNRSYAVPTDNPFVGRSGVLPEIWSYGLRNPWRPSFDRQTGDLYLADVGQDAREELNFQPATSVGGENYGWRSREGKIATPGSVGGPRPANNVDPVYDYPHGAAFGGRGSITGGYVYRGEFLKPLIDGQYFFGDFIRGTVASFDSAELSGIRDFTDLSAFSPGVTDRTSQLLAGSPISVASFGEDAAGELYLVDYRGRLLRLTADRLVGDLNFDDRVDTDDLGILLANFGLSDRSINEGDLDHNRFVDLSDVELLLNGFGRGRTGPIDIDEAEFARLIEQAAGLGIVIPEPTAGTLVLAGTVGLLLRKRPRTASRHAYDRRHA